MISYFAELPLYFYSDLQFWFYVACFGPVIPDTSVNDQNKLKDKLK